MRGKIVFLSVCVLSYSLAACVQQPLAAPVPEEQAAAEAPAAAQISKETVTPMVSPGKDSAEATASPGPAGPAPDRDKQDMPDSAAKVEGGKSGLPNLSPALNQLLADWPAGPGVDQAVQQGVEVAGNRVKVMLIMQDQASAEAAVAALPGLNGEVIAHYETWIDAWVPVEALGEVANLPGISLVQQPIATQPLD